MAQTNKGLPTLYDIAKSMNPDGTVATPAEIIAQTNPILRDIPILEANLSTGHRENIRNGLPDAYWRRYNQGVIPSKSRQEQVTDTIGSLWARSQIDEELAKINGNSAAWRLSEEKAFLESMGQELASTIFYGSEIDTPEQFTGLTPRYSDLNPAYPVHQNIIDAGGTTGELTSIWLIHWDTDTLNFRYPKGQAQGDIIETNDMGVQTITDGGGGRYEVLETKFVSNLGLSVKDWRYAVRICNIPVALLTDDGATYDLWTLLTKAMHKIPMKDKGMPYFYMNRTVGTYLDIQGTNKANIRLKPMELATGEMAEAYRMIPFRECDGLLNTEERVVSSAT
jgi:hypothetical protein